MSRASIRGARKTRSYVASGNSLFSCCLQGESDAIEILLVQGVDPNFQEEKGFNTPLHAASYIGDVDICKKLLSSGASPRLENREGQTPLHLARHPSVVSLLVPTVNNANPRDIRGWTPLHCAAESCSNQVVCALLKFGADPNIEEDTRKWTPLFLSVLRRNVDVASSLLKAGADPNLRGKGGWTPLHYASQQGDYRTMWLLLKAGADPRLCQFAGLKAVSSFRLFSMKAFLSLASGYKRLGVMLSGLPFSSPGRTLSLLASLCVVTALASLKRFI
mmetsp:Transcript_6009/g.14602  ORF Transcript_6009/g.14602 Transcript_6009/m.14602 type:complete len:276 (-) Transcript_6009:942-1769(-)